jgi:hypothetical protein
MNRTAAFLLAVACVALPPRAARADLIAWSYNWEPAAPAVFADSPATGKVAMSDEPAASAAGNSQIVATNLRTFSSASPGTPATFTNQGYGLILSLTDTASGTTGTLNFAGQLNGILSASYSVLANKFTAPTVKSLTLGGNTYTVTLDGYTAPPPPGAANAGSIGATVAVAAGSKSTGGGGGGGSSPEPSTAVLACLGLAGLSVAGRWRAHRLAGVARKAG